MRPTKNIKRLIKNTGVKTNPEVNEAVLKNLLNELDKSESIRSATKQLNTGRIIKQSLAMKLAAAVVIITALYFTIFYAGTNEQSGNIELREVQSKSRAEMMSILTINTIYRQRGFDAVQRHFEMISELKGSHQRKTITLRDILAELNGNGHDRSQL